jgi:hypothetical protein
MHTYGSQFSQQETQVFCSDTMTGLVLLEDRLDALLTPQFWWFASLGITKTVLAPRSSCNSQGLWESGVTEDADSVTLPAYPRLPRQSTGGLLCYSFRGFLSSGFCVLRRRYRSRSALQRCQGWQTRVPQEFSSQIALT